MTSVRKIKDKRDAAVTEAERLLRIVRDARALLTKTLANAVAIHPGLRPDQVRDAFDKILCDVERTDEILKFAEPFKQESRDE